MNHRRSPGGYHSRLTAGALALALTSGCAPLAAPPARRLATVAPGSLWRAEREAVVAQINAARAAAGAPPLAYDAVLERVGDAHCEILIVEGGQGHFSRSGVPPYLRYLLAGGSGFHRENAAMYSSSAPVPIPAVAGILAGGVASMLAERPPDDGHRRALLEPEVTHIGVGVAARGGEVRMTHELATERAIEWSAPPAVARPRTPVTLAGRLAPPWRPVAAELLWEELPRPIPDARLRTIRAYGYPQRRMAFDANRRPGERPIAAGGGEPGQTAAAPLAVDRFGNFSLRWVTGPADGVEIVVIEASDGRRPGLVPVAASVTVVTAAGTLPDELAPWRRLAGAPAPARSDDW